MRCCILSMGVMSAMLLVITLHTAQSHPVTLDRAELLEIVPVNDKDSITSNEEAERNKRMVTIAQLRQLFPGLFQIIDAKVEDLVKYIVGIAGKAILQGGLFGGGGGGGDTSSASDSSSSATSGASVSSRGRVSITLPTFPPDPDDEDDSSSDSQSSASESASTSSDKSEANNLVGAESQRNEVKVPFNQPESDNKKPASENKQDEEEEEDEDEEEDDQDASATGDHEKSLDPADDLSNLDDDEDERDKRHFNVGFGADASAGGSAGGSGNFLFDIIRNTADRAARTAGTFYRLVAGTESLGDGITHYANTKTATLQPVYASNQRSFLQKLVAGSGSSASSGSSGEQADEQAHGAIGFTGGISAEGHASDEPIPGPITRLFVVANRSVANLVQDLILRLAQTSERFVNFKAKLITSLI